MKKQYRKVWVNRMDPETGLQWMQTEYVPVKRRINWVRLVDRMMTTIMLGYIALWCYWAATVMIPAICK